MAATIAGLLAFAVTASAQDAKQEGKKGQGLANVQQRVDQMSEELKLTPEQKTKVTALMEEQGKKMQGMRDMAPEERREKGRAMREEMETKMKAILKPDQYEKWLQLRPQRGPGGGKGEAKGEGKAKKQ